MREHFESHTVGWRSYRSMISRGVSQYGEEIVNKYLFNKVDSRKRAMYLMSIANENDWSTEAKEKIAERAAKYK